MDLRDRLLHDHVDLEALCVRLAQAVDRAEPAPDVCKLREALNSRLCAHLAEEDKLVYSRLLRDGSAQARWTATRLRAEIGDLAGDWRRYIQRWSPQTIDRDPDGFRDDTATVITRLRDRIRREDRELYPLLDTA